MSLPNRLLDMPHFLPSSIAQQMASLSDMCESALFKEFALPSKMEFLAGVVLLDVQADAWVFVWALPFKEVLLADWIGVHGIAVFEHFVHEPLFCVELLDYPGDIEHFLCKSHSLCFLGWFSGSFDVELFHCINKRLIGGNILEFIIPCSKLASWTLHFFLVIQLLDTFFAEAVTTVDWKWF